MRRGCFFEYIDFSEQVQVTILTIHTVRGCNNNMPVDEVIEILIRMDRRFEEMNKCRCCDMIYEILSAHCVTECFGSAGWLKKCDGVVVDFQPCGL